MQTQSKISEPVLRDADLINTFIARFLAGSSPTRELAINGAPAIQITRQVVGGQEGCVILGLRAAYVLPGLEKLLRQRWPKLTPLEATGDWLRFTLEDQP